MTLEFVQFDPNSFSYIAMNDDSRVGHVHVNVENDSATIADILVAESYRKFIGLSFLKKKVTFRNQGIGTALLTQAIEKCRELELNEVDGKMHGDEEALTRWYSSFGFIIVGNKISLKL